MLVKSGQLESVQEDIQQQLMESAADYANAGLDMYFRGGSQKIPSQSIIGNMAIAIELLLKSIIARISLLLLYTNLPLDVRCALSAPKDHPRRFTEARYVIDLKSAHHRSLTLKDTITCYGFFYPEFKNSLSAHFSFLSQNRNASIHSVTPSFRVYEVERTIFLFLSIVEQLKKEDTNNAAYRHLRNKKSCNLFLTKFDGDRIARVHKKIEAATKRARRTDQFFFASPEGWSESCEVCPVCDTEALICGETQENYEEDDDSSASLVLTFVAETFECPGCGLKLEDYDELKIAGIDPITDRSDEVDSWMEDHYQDD